MPQSSYTPANSRFRMGLGTAEGLADGGTSGVADRHIGTSGRSVTDSFRS